MRSVLFTATLVAALGCTALSALSQPMHQGSPLGMLSQIKDQLNLNTSQQQQWDAVAAQSKAAREAARAAFAQVNSALQVELAKPEPDLASVAALRDSVHQQIEAQHKQTRDAWLALYANFTPEQKTMVRDAIKAGLDNLAARRALRKGETPTTE